jgi:hypothetical protein
MNYFQSFKENGMPNSSGWIEIWGDQYPNDFFVSRWNFELNKWEKCEDNGYGKSVLYFDGNGVLNGLYKTNAHSAEIFDSDRILIRYIALYNNSGVGSNNYISAWDDTAFENKLEAVKKSMDELNSLKKIKKIYLDGDASIYDKEGLVMAINDSGKTHKVSYNDTYAVVPDGCIAVFIGTRSANGSISHFSLQ